MPDPGAAAPRVVFSPVPHLDGVLDGGWWPHTHLADELPALSGVVASRLGTVVRVALSATAWDARPEEVTCGGRVVAVAFRRWWCYARGGPLPAAHREWVLHDMTCRSWWLRHLGRSLVQLVPVVAVLMLLIPGPFWVRGRR
jgi:hypothetical protein